MQNFEYQNVTRTVFGTDAVDKIGGLITGQRVLIHYGSGSVVKSGLLGRVKQILESAGIEAVYLGGVQPNPRLSLAREGVDICRKNGVDFVLAVGGGSVIDSAKCIALGAMYDGDVWDFYTPSTGLKPTSALPVGTVLTIPAAGSESSPVSVMTKAPNLKRSTSGQAIRPVFAALDPTLTYTLPAWQTASGVVDIMAHIMERYFSREEGCDFSDRLCEGALKSMMHCGRVVMEEPENYQARADIMWAGSIAHNGLLGMGRTEDWSTHKIEHELSGEFDVTHGAGLAIIFPAWMQSVYKEAPHVFVRFATRVMNVDTRFGDCELTINRGIEALRDFYRQMGMPVRMSELPQIRDTSDAMLMKLAERTLRTNPDGTVGSMKCLNTEDIFNIYKLAL